MLKLFVTKNGHKNHKFERVDGIELIYVLRGYWRTELESTLKESAHNQPTKHIYSTIFLVKESYLKIMNNVFYTHNI